MSIVRKKTGNRKYTAKEWRVWKRNQRKKPKIPSGSVRHHTSSGKITTVSRKRHAAIHKKSGTQGGRGRKKRSRK